MPTVDPLARWRLLIKEMGGGTLPTNLTTPYGVASTDLLTSTNHGLVANDRVRFTSLTGGAGLAVDTVYRVSGSGLTANDFKVTDVSNGAIINFTTNVTAGAFYKVGAANKTSLTVNSTTNVYRQSATTSFISPYPHNETIGAGGPYAVEPIVVPYNSANGTGGSFWKMLEGPKVGGLISFWTNTLGYGSITLNEDATFNRGPGNTILTLEYPAAHAADASLNYNAAGEMHFTMLVDDPNIPLIRPKRTHYAIEFYNGSTWDEVFAGMVWDFEATETEVVFYGIDYLGLLQYVWDERFDPAKPRKPAPTGSFYATATISSIITAHLNYSVGLPNSLVGFLAVGTIATMSETVAIFSTMQNSLDFVIGLINSHKAGTGKMTRLKVVKIAGVYTLTVVEDPGVHKDDLALAYIAGGLVQGYQTVPFGTDWASRVNLIGRARDGAEIIYKGDDSAVDQNTWGRIGQAPVMIESIDKNDLNRRARQAALDASKLGRQLGVGLRVGSFRPLEDYDLCDQVPVAISHGAVITREWGSDVFGADPSGNPSAVEALYWSITNLIFKSFDDGHWITELGLWPVGGGAALPAGGATQALAQHVYYNSNMSGGKVHAVLNTPPGEGSLLVAVVASEEGDITMPYEPWTLRASGYGYYGGQYGGPGSPARLAVYTRIAGASETIYAAGFAGIGSGATDGALVYLAEFKSGEFLGVTLLNDAVMLPGATNAVSATVPAGKTGLLYLIVCVQREEYADTDTWTPAAGTTEIVEGAGPANVPGLYIASKQGAGALTASATKDYNAEMNSWGYSKVGLLIGTSGYISVSAPVAAQTPISVGSGPPAADNTSSETYVDLNTGQQYVRNDVTDTWDLVPGSMPLRNEPGVLAFGREQEEPVEFWMPGPTGPPGPRGLQGPPGQPGLDGEDSEVVLLGPTTPPPLTVRIAAAVPTGAPAQGELWVAVDTTAVTGGVYTWDGAAWIKGATI